MTKAITKASPPGSLQPWAPREGETAQEHLAFIWWVYHGGPRDDALASRYGWAERAQQIESLNSLGTAEPAEQAIEAVRQRVEVAITEMGKLHSRIMADPNAVLQPGEIMKEMEWLTATIEGLREREAALNDYSVLTPEDRETMLKAEQIQRELLG